MIYIGLTVLILYCVSGKNTNTFFDNSISIYGYSLAIERNLQYGISEYLDGFIMIGDDGYGRELFIQKEDTALLLYYLDLGAIGSMNLSATNQNLFEWVE